MVLRILFILHQFFQPYNTYHDNNSLATATLIRNVELNSVNVTSLDKYRVVRTSE